MRLPVLLSCCELTDCGCQDVCNDDFSKKYKLANAGGNKLAKMKYKEFQTLFEEFSETASKKEKELYLE